MGIGEMNWILANAEKLGGLATAGTMIAALCALVFAWNQTTQGRNSQREATAKDIYRDYLRLAFENPKFANPNKLLGMAEGWKQNGEWIQDERYRWFVAFMLNSYDEIALCNPKDNTWRLVILEDLNLHREYLKSREFKHDEGGWDLFSSQLQKIAAEL